MLRFWDFITCVLILVLIGPAAFGASENLVRNGGFEILDDNGRAAGWLIRIDGDWTGDGKMPVFSHEMINISSDARTGEQALVVDTTRLNPSGKITDELRDWKHPKYEIHFIQPVRGVKPGAWYLAKFRIKAPKILVDEGLQLLVDLRPWPYPVVRRESFGVDPWGYSIDGRLFQPAAPISDGDYHEYILLKRVPSNVDTIEIGLRIRAPWTGTILIDDVELREINPDKEMTPMQKLLAMRAAIPFDRVRELHRETSLAADGKAASAILVPPGDNFRTMGGKIQAMIRDLTGAIAPVVTKLSDVPAGSNIIALGSMMKNELVARLHFNRYVRVDALSPGAGGYVLWSVPEPYGLARRQNVIVVAGSDAAGQALAVEAFCEQLARHVDKNKRLQLPFMHMVVTRNILPAEKRQVDRTQWGYRPGRWPLAGFAKWHHSNWLATGDLKIAKLARKEILDVIEHYLNNPYTVTAWDTFEVGLAWDCMEEVPVFSDADRLRITNFFLAYLHMRPKITSDWAYLVPRLKKNTPTWNHQAKGLSAVYTMGRYFDRYYGEKDGRYKYYLAAARNAFRQQASSSKPEENSGNYTQITMKFALSYYLGEWELDFFTNGAMSRYAEFFATVANNKGWMSGFGDTYYCYDGCAADSGSDDFEVPLAFWYTKDPRLLWWLQKMFPDWNNPYHQDVEPAEWKELLGIHKIPLEKILYDKRSRLNLWGADGEGAEQPYGGAEYAETFDKISFRENWLDDGQYMLLEGIGRGIHSGRSTNQICKLSILGEDLLIGSTYINNNVRTSCTLLAVKDSDIDDPIVKGRASGDAWWQQPRWAPLALQYPAYAALETLADLANCGFSRTTMREFLYNTRWTRNVFWLKGDWFVLIDELTAREPGSYYLENNLRTCPNKAGDWPTITPRTGTVLSNNRGFEIAISDALKTKHYLLTDGTAEVVTENAKARDVSSIMMRQVHEGLELAAGQKVSFMTLMYGDIEEDRANYRIERIGDAEAVIFQGTQPVAYLGCGQSAKSRSILPINAKMFLLSDKVLSLVDATSAGVVFSSATPVSRDVVLSSKQASAFLSAFAALAERPSAGE